MPAAQQKLLDYPKCSRWSSGASICHTATWPCQQAFFSCIGVVAGQTEDRQKYKTGLQLQGDHAEIGMQEGARPHSEWFGSCQALTTYSALMLPFAVSHNIRHQENLPFRISLITQPALKTQGLHQQDKTNGVVAMLHELHQVCLLDCALVSQLP